MKRTREPNHPGKILYELYLVGLGITLTDFADGIGVSRKAISAIVNGHKRVTPEMALRFSKAFNTTPELWLNLQQSHDLWMARIAIEDEISSILPLHVMA